MPEGYVYILGSDSGTLYIGVTSNLGKRILEHKRGEGSEFTTSTAATAFYMWSTSKTFGRQSIAKHH